MQGRQYLILIGLKEMAPPLGHYRLFSDSGEVKGMVLGRLLKQGLVLGVVYSFVVTQDDLTFSSDRAGP